MHRFKSSSARDTSRDLNAVLVWLKRFLWVGFLISATVVHAAGKGNIYPDAPRFDFRGVNVAQVVQLIYSEAIAGAYVIDPEVLGDQRSVSFRYDSSKGDLQAFIGSFLDSLGLVVNRRDGVDFISRKPTSEKVKEPRDVFVYRPRFRDGSYLVDLLSPLFDGQFTARRVVHAAGAAKSPQGAVPPGSAAAMIDRKSDILVFSGSTSEIEMLKKMLEQVDQSAGDVIVQGVLYEVQTTSSDGSAFNLALNLLGGNFGLSISSIGLENSISFKNKTIEAVISSLSSDSRFTVRSTPTLRVASGENGRFTVGQDVPVLGAVSYAGNTGTPIRSVEYRSSGVIFDLTPVVHDEEVDLTVMQQISNFVATDTGVNDSPTLIKRELKTSLTVANGEIVIIGGLAENKETESGRGFSFLPGFMRARDAQTSRSEILLVLQLTKI